MSGKARAFTKAIVTATAMLGWSAGASAHISLEQGGTHKSRNGDGLDQIKAGPCGVAGSTRGTTNVYTYQAGETITITLSEYIPHPSYFRIAFDNDGDDGFADPASIKPIDATRPCPYNANDKCGDSDFYNNDTVLPNMDNLDPHVTATTGTKYTWEVTLPNTPCDNCTLQIIQVMQDTIHGPYNPKATSMPEGTAYVEDVYHQCIDLVLTAGPVADAGVVVGADAGAGTAGAGTAGAAGVGAAGLDGAAGTAPTGTAGVQAAAGTDGGGAAGTTPTGAAGVNAAGTAGTGAASSDSGGCSMSTSRAGSSAALYAWALAIGLVVARRRRVG